jgi:hypothetical protein
MHKMITNSAREEDVSGHQRLIETPSRIIEQKVKGAVITIEEGLLERIDYWARNGTVVNFAFEMMEGPRRIESRFGHQPIPAEIGSGGLQNALLFQEYKMSGQ